MLTPTTWGAGSGQASYSGGVYTLSGTGTYANGQSRENGIADLRPMTGNLQIQARVTSETGFLGSDTGAAVFIRDNATSSADASIFWLENTGGADYLYADRVGGGNLVERLNGLAGIPNWVRLQDWNGIITPAISTDGTNWNQLPSFDMTSELGAGLTLTYGLAVWSGRSGQAMTVTFDNVCISAFTPSPTLTLTPAPTATPTPVPVVTVTSTPPPGVKVWPNPVIPGNPPNDKTHFQLPSGHGAGHLVIADLKRHKVRSSDFGPGEDVQWDAKDNGGTTVPSGVYLYLLEADGSVRRGSITVMR